MKKLYFTPSFIKTIQNTLLLPFFCLLLSGGAYLNAQTQVGTDIDGEGSSDQSGYSVSLSSDGTRMAIGAPFNSGGDKGHVRVYSQSGGSWTQVGSDIDGEAANDQSGFSVSLSSDGTRVAIGAFQNDGNGSNSGHVRVYEESGGSWTQVGSDIDGEAASDQSGRSVALSSDGTRVAIGATKNDDNGNDSGHVRVYSESGGSWTQVGSDIDGEAAGDESGSSVALSSDGTRVAIGARFNDGNGSSSGHVRVYSESGGSWTQVGSDIDGEAVNDRLGISVSLSSDGTRVAIGASGNDGNGSDSGHVRVYSESGGSWTQVGSDIDGEAANDQSGFSVALSSDGTRVAIGAFQNDGNGSNSGHVRVYEENGGSWTQVGSDIDGEAADDQSGWSVGLSSDGMRVAIGAPDNDGSFNNAGHVRVYFFGITVCASGCDHTTIAAAVAAASAGDIIEVLDATHTEQGITINKNLTIQGQGQTTTTVQAAASQAAATNRVFLVSTGMTVTFQNMTIQNGKSANHGGGVRIHTNASTNVTFTNVTINNNKAENDDGGGVYITNSDGTVTFTNCVISNNEANVSDDGASGGGIFNEGASTLTLTRCTLFGNSAGNHGGAIRNGENGSTMKLINCTLYNNTAGAGNSSSTQGGAIQLFQGTNSLINCTIVNNSVTNATTRKGGGVFYGSSITNVSFINTIVANNSGATLGNDVRGEDPNNSQTTSLVEDCNGNCPAFSYSSDANIATSASTCGNHSYFDVAGSDAENTGTAPTGDIPSTDICGSAVVGNKEIGSYETSNIVPVEFIDFQGKATTDAALLTWQTASETNNKGFEIEWSLDSRTWQNIGFVAGAGDSFEEQAYSFVHKSPREGINYYRLKQVDFDGAFEYSNVVSVDLLNLGDLANLRVVPNPVRDGSFTLYLPENEAEIITMQLYDYAGRLIHQQVLTSNETTVDVNQLLPGLYLTQVQIDGKRFFERVLIQ